MAEQQEKLSKSKNTYLQCIRTSEECECVQDTMQLMILVKKLYLRNLDLMVGGFLENVRYGNIILK
jgi:hypothetical protein